MTRLYQSANRCLLSGNFEGRLNVRHGSIQALTSKASPNQGMQDGSRRRPSRSSSRRARIQMDRNRRRVEMPARSVAVQDSGCWLPRPASRATRNHREDGSFEEQHGDPRHDRHQPPHLPRRRCPDRRRRRHSRRLEHAGTCPIRGKRGFRRNRSERCRLSQAPHIRPTCSRGPASRHR